MNLLFQVGGVFRRCREPAEDEIFELRLLAVEQGKVLQFPGRDLGGSAESCEQKIYELGIEQAQNVEQVTPSFCLFLGRKREGETLHTLRVDNREVCLFRKC